MIMVENTVDNHQQMQSCTQDPFFLLQAGTFSNQSHLSNFRSEE